MKKFTTRILVLLLLAASACPSVMAQRYSRSYSRHHHGYSTYGRAMRGLHAVETAADYAILGSVLHNIDDYTGFRIGYNSASLHASGFDATQGDNIPAFNLGIVFGWYLGNTDLALEPGLYYSMKGGNLNELYDSNFSKKHGLSTTEFTMHSFEVPLVLKMHLPIASGVGIEPFAGAFMSFGFAGTTTLDNGDEYDTFDDRFLEDFDAGFRFGAGLSINNLYFEAAYDLGLVNLCDSYEFDRHEALRSRTWSFNIGINF